jgi:small-conductance mechanosensitive channel
MKRRRISFTIRVSYQTDAAQIKEIPKLLAGIITNMPNTELNRSHFSGFGDYGLNFDVVYYVLTRDYIAYMDIQEEINLKIIDEFSKRGINFTYPTQTLYVKRG